MNQDLRANPRQKLKDITENINSGLQPLGESVSKKSVCKAIHNDLRMSSCHACSKPFLKSIHMSTRMAWAKGLENWTMAEWLKIIWTDEMSFEIGKDARVTLVWRPPNHQYEPQYLKPSFKSGRTRLMLWGAIAYNMPDPLIRIPPNCRKASDYINIVLEGPLQCFYREMKVAQGGTFIVEDGAPVHTAKVTREWHKNHEMKVLFHPSNTPDLNPIENVWSYLKNVVNDRPVRPKNIDEAEAALFEEWGKIDLIYINTVIESMPKQVQKILKANGNSIKY